MFIQVSNSIKLLNGNTGSHNTNCSMTEAISHDNELKHSYLTSMLTISIPISINTFTRFHNLK